MYHYRRHSDGTRGLVSNGCSARNPRSYTATKRGEKAGSSSPSTESGCKGEERWQKIMANLTAKNAVNQFNRAILTSICSFTQRGRNGKSISIRPAGRMEESRSTATQFLAGLLIKETAMFSLVKAHCHNQNISYGVFFRAAYYKKYGKDMPINSLQEDVDDFARNYEVPAYVVEYVIAIYGAI